MEFKYFSKDGEILPTEKAVVPLSSIEYQYGFGVYESVRVAGSTPRFLDDHLARLQESARAIGLEHSFSNSSIYGIVRELIEKNAVETCNLKILLIGGKSAAEASLYILCLNPLFPDKALYRDGVPCITYPYERLFPHAKTLNMLGSYLAYRASQRAGAYDALLVNRAGHITEGTRTNFFCMREKTIASSPEKAILPGVMRKKILEIAAKNGYVLEEKSIVLSDVVTYDGAFLTSTSSKILPIRSIDDTALRIPPAMCELMRLFDAFLKNETSRGKAAS